MKLSALWSNSNLMAPEVLGPDGIAGGFRGYRVRTYNSSIQGACMEHAGNPNSRPTLQLFVAWKCLAAKESFRRCVALLGLITKALNSGLGWRQVHSSIKVYIPIRPKV